VTDDTLKPTNIIQGDIIQQNINTNFSRILM